MYAIREKYGAAVALEIIERVWKMEDRIKNITNRFLTIFKIEGNDAETIAKWIDIWNEVCGYEYTWLERSKTSSRVKITKCPFKTVPKDISNYCKPFLNIVGKTINPKATVESPKGMCAGDPYCEFLTKTEE